MIDAEAKGKAEGMAEGEAKGKAEGEAKASYEIARKLIVRGTELKDVAAIAGLTPEQTERLREEIRK